jgi:hypothetical protein
MTFEREVLPAERQATSGRHRPPERPAGPSSVVQQLGTIVGNRSLARLVAVARRPQKAREPTTADLEELAKRPDRAHRSWKRLGLGERIQVYSRMQQRYGKDFAESFRKYAEAGKPDYDARDCELGVCTPEQYLKQGYKVAERADHNIWLVHPSGRLRYLFGGHAPSKPPEDGKVVEPPPPEEPPIEEPPEVVDPPPPDLLQTDEPPIDYSGASGVQRTPCRGAAPPKRALLRDPKEVSFRVGEEHPDYPYDWHASFAAEVTGGALVLTIRAKLEPARDVTDAEWDAVMKQAEPEFKRVWDNKFLVSEDGGKTELPVRVKLEWVVQKAHLVASLQKGSREDNRRNWFVSSPAIHRAHELGHQLGLLDEKIDPKFPNRKDAKSPGAFQDNSIMGDYMTEGIDKATVKLRHGQKIIDEVNKVLGKKFTIRLNAKKP